MGYMTSATSGVILTGGNTIYNEASADKDFRIESNGQTHMLFVDAGEDGVAIGTSANDTNALLTVGGAMALLEASAPTATADVGKVWTQTDNHLYFQDGAGNNRKVTEEVFIVSLSDETTDLTTGTAKATFSMPFAFNLTSVIATVTTAPAGSTLIVDINEGGSTILTTKLSIDASELTSTSAASGAVIGGAGPAIANAAALTFDIDQIGSGTAGKGLKVYLYGYRTA
jgi:hypothetical protein